MRAAVGAHGHEVHLDRELDGAHEVCHEDGGALEHAHDEQLLILVVRGDLGAHLGDLLANLLLGDQYPLDVLVHRHAPHCYGIW